MPHVLDPLLDLLYRPRNEWSASAIDLLQKSLTDRYKNIGKLKERDDEKRFAVRLNANDAEGNVPYLGIIAPGQERSGPYGGMSFVLFPSDTAGQPALVAMVVGTQGLAPDEMILGRPGHARRCRGLASWYRSKVGPEAAWAKADPVRTDIELTAPKVVRDHWQGAAGKYGKEMYATFVPPADPSAHRDTVLKLLAGLLDLALLDRGVVVKKDAAEESHDIERAWLQEVLPATDPAEIGDLLATRRFVVLEGPPGTGKTRLADALLRGRYQGRGQIVQFHPGTTYETFIGGLAPVAIQQGLGLAFAPTPGHLMAAIVAARKTPEPYLLVIDEINRADLAKVLGEAIYLFEPGEPNREVTLAHEFPHVGNKLRLPANLHVLGTMNSADRSIAILDLAIRRRFGFVRLWPQVTAMDGQHELLQRGFRELLAIFVEHAPDDVLALMPGHAYFLGTDATTARNRLRTEVRPLLEEYLAQGYVAALADHVRAYLDRLGV